VQAFCGGRYYGGLRDARMQFNEFELKTRERIREREKNVQNSLEGGERYFGLNWNKLNSS